MKKKPTKDERKAAVMAEYAQVSDAALAKYHRVTDPARVYKAIVAEQVKAQRQPLKESPRAQGCYAVLSDRQRLCEKDAVCRVVPYGGALCERHAAIAIRLFDRGIRTGPPFSGDPRPRKRRPAKGGKGRKS